MGDPVVKSCNTSYGRKGYTCWVDSTQPIEKIRKAIAKKMQGTRYECPESNIVFNGWKGGLRTDIYRGYGFYCLGTAERRVSPREGEFVLQTLTLLGKRHPSDRQGEVEIVHRLTAGQIKHAIDWHYKKYEPANWCSTKRIVLRSAKMEGDTLRQRRCTYSWKCWRPGTKKPSVGHFDKGCAPMVGVKRAAIRTAHNKTLETIRKTKILFIRGSHSLSNKAKNKLDAIVDVLDKNPGIRIEIHGHASKEGTGNEQLSNRRAKAVYSYLQGRMARSYQLEDARGYGSTQPTGKGYVYDRRVDFVVRGKPKCLSDCGQRDEVIRHRPRYYTEKQYRAMERKKPVGVCNKGWKPVRIRVGDSGRLKFKVVPCGNNPILINKKKAAEHRKWMKQFLKDLVWTLTPDLRANIFTRHRLVGGEATDTGFQISAAHWGTLAAKDILLGGFQYGVAYSGGSERNLLDVSAGIAGGLKFPKSQLRLEVDIGGTFLLSGEEDLAATQTGGFLRYALSYTHMLGRWIGIGGHVSVQHPWKRMDRPSIFFGPHMTVRFKE